MAKSKKREQILIAAAKLFRDRGYQATSMRDLAEAVDLKASSLYNHIGSKEEMLKEICIKNADKFTHGMRSIQIQNINPLEKIKSLIELHVGVAISDYTSVISFNDEWRHLTEPSLTAFKEKRKFYENQFLEIIQAGIKQSLLKNVNPKIILYVLLSSTRWLYDSNSINELTESKAEIIDLIVEGIIA